MPLPTTSLNQHSLLTAKAVGPFSFCYQRGDCSIARMTEYPAPDGGWEWKTCFAYEWTPELSGYQKEGN
jgi:hypothetical protein